MEPPDHKKQVLIGLAGAAMMLAFVGNFFWNFFKDFRGGPANGNHGSNVPLLIFGGFFLLVVLIVVANVMAAVRRPANPPPVAAPAGTGGRIFLILFSLPFAGFGLFALVQAFRKWGANQFHDAAGLGVFGLIFCGVGFGLLALMIFGGKKQRAADAVRSQRPDQPWLWRPDWAAGKIKSTAGAQVKLFAVMAVAFCGMGGLFTFTVLPKELQKGNYPALLVLLFPVVGIGFVIAIVRAVRARRRFGDCYFELAQIPAPLGGTLDGMIQTGARLRLEHGLHLKLSCIRRVVTGSGKNQNTQETVLWQDEKVFAPDAGLPEPEPGHSGIPVFFKLPSDQPECFARGNETVLWRLEAKSQMRGPDFSATFEVPVFQVAGAVVAEEANEPDPTAALQMPVEELRRDENSKILVTDGPRGREFYFPAARNPGAAIMTTVFALVFNGATVATFHFHAPILFPIVLGLFGALIFCFAFSLWFKSSRVTVDSTGVSAVNRWLLFSRTRRFAAADIVRFDTKVGMTSGTQTFQDLKLVTAASANSYAASQEKFQQTGERPPLKFAVSSHGGVTLAGGLASKPEADWLVQEMTRALGRRPALQPTMQSI